MLVKQVAGLHVTQSMHRQMFVKAFCECLQHSCQVWSKTWCKHAACSSTSTISMEKIAKDTNTML